MPRQGLSTGRHNPFVGRTDELSDLRGWLELAEVGDPQVVVIDGEPGIGKSALVQRFLDESHEKAVVLSATADEAEARSPWALLSQLLKSAGPGPLASLADSVVDAAADGDPFVIGAALLTGLGELQREQGTVVVVVEDVGIADDASIRAVIFAIRRLLGDRVLVLATARPEFLPGPWASILSDARGHRLSLGGLTPGELADLAGALGAGAISVSEAASFHVQTDGNPLYAASLLRSLGARTFRPREDTRPLRAPPELSNLILARLAECAPPTRDLVSAAAVLGRRFSVAKAMRIAEIADPIEALDEAVTAHLIVEDHDSSSVSFSHALVRAAVYEDLGPARRAALHARAAHFCSGRTALSHRFAACVGADDALAAELEAFAEYEAERGALDSAAEHLRQASTVSTPGKAADRRLLEAVATFLLAGEAETARLFEEEVADVSPGPHRDYVLGYLALLAGRIEEAERSFARGWEGLGNPDSGVLPDDLPGRIAVQLAIVSVLDLRTEEIDTWSKAALATAGGDERALSFALFSRAFGLAVGGRCDDALSVTFGTEVPDTPDVLIARGIARLWGDDPSGARKDLHAAFSRARTGEVLRVSQGMGFLGEAEYRLGALDDSILHTELAIESAKLAGRAWDFPFLYSLAALPRAARGDFEDAQRHVSVAGEWAELVPMAAARAYVAVAGIALGIARCDNPGLLEAGRALDSVYDLAEPGTCVFGPAVAEALLELGRLDEAEDALESYEAKALKSGRRSALLGAARVRGSLETARSHHGRALSTFEAGNHLASGLELPLERSRFEASHGMALASAGDLAGARSKLETALVTLNALGARPYAARVKVILAKLGATQRGSNGVALTPAEVLVARLVGAGLSNRQVAEELVVSVKAVEYHLSNIYRRLGVSSRVNLVRRLATEDARSILSTRDEPGAGGRKH